MTYNITLTNGSNLSTPTMINGQLLDGTTDTSTGLTLIGRNVTGYGQVQNDNFIRLLENFSGALPPNSSINATVVLQGQLWYDSTNQKMMVYDGTEFIPVSQRTAGITAPAITQTGDQWWDTVNNQLKVWAGSSWVVIGPLYTATQGKTGALVEYATNSSTNVSYAVVNTYANNNLISTTSYYPAFTPAESLYSSIGTIYPGINLSSTSYFNGTATNANTLAGLAPSAFLSATSAVNSLPSLRLQSNLTVGQANVVFSGSNLAVINNSVSGNVDIYVNSPTGGNIRALHIHGSNGLAYVATDPLYPMGIVTKNYVDTNFNSLQATVTNQLNQQLSSSQVNTAINSAISGVTLAYDPKFLAINAAIATTTTAMNVAVQTGNTILSNWITGANASIASLGVTVSGLAPINNPTFTGTVTTTEVPSLQTYLQTLPQNANQFILTFTNNFTFSPGDLISLQQVGSSTVLASLTVVYSNGGGNFVVVSQTPFTSMMMPNVVNNNGQVLYNNIQPIVNNVARAIYLTGVRYLGPLLSSSLILGDLSSNVATTRYVDVTANILATDYTNKIQAISNSLSGSSTSGLALKADLAGATFTGTVSISSTIPVQSNDTTVPTTSWVKARILDYSNNVRTITPSNSPPSGGKDGDVWLQYGE